MPGVNIDRLSLTDWNVPNSIPETEYISTGCPSPMIPSIPESELKKKRVTLFACNSRFLLEFDATNLLSLIVMDRFSALIEYIEPSLHSNSIDVLSSAFIDMDDTISNKAADSLINL